MNNETLSSNIELITENGIKINGLSNVVENQEIHYLVYKITNLVNGKYYIGQHQTKNPYDDYMGSGLMLENAKAKYGIDNFVKTILFDFDNKIEMNQKELELMPEISCNCYNPMCYNLSPGGYGGDLGKDANIKRKEVWNNKSVEEIQYIVNQRKQTIDNKSQEEKDKTKKLISDNSKRMWKKTSFRQKKKEYLASLTQEEKDAINKKHSQTYHNKSYKEKEQIKIKRKQTMALKTEKEKQEIIKKYKQSIASKTQEEKDKTKQKISIASKHNWESDEYRKKWHQTIDNRTVEQKQHTNELKYQTINNRTLEKQQQVHDNISIANKLSYQMHPKRAKNHSKRMSGKGNPMYGHPVTEFMTDEEIKNWKENISKAVSGEKNSCYGRKWMHLKGSSRKEDRVYVRENEFQKYLDKGYIFGMKEVKGK